MKQAEFSRRLTDALSQRKAKNSRYSLRAFALLLGTDHSTLSQVLKGRRQVSAAQLTAWCGKLGIDQEEATAFAVTAAAPGASEFAHAEHLRHWSAEAMSILADPTHWRVVELLRSRGFTPDTRWLAQNSGVTPDHVNIVLTRLLRLELIEMQDGGLWRVCKDCARTEEDFRKAALRQVRSKACNLVLTER